MAAGYADFYALMPPDNAATVGVGTDVSFPRDGASSGGIERVNDTTFRLSEIGVYLIQFQVGANEAGQLVLTLNGNDLPATMTGRATGTSPIIGMAIVETDSVDSVITVRNPANGASALTITPYAGGPNPVSAHLIVLRLA